MLTIIGCGNPTRSDDGVGVKLAQRLAERFRRHPVPGVQVFDCGTAGMEVMFAARGSDALIIVDACRSGSPPGSLFEVPGEELARAREARDASMTLHDFRWDDALTAGRAIFGASFPVDVQVFLVEAASVDFGLELSSAVAATSEQLFARLLDRIARYAVARHAQAPARRLSLRRGQLYIGAALHAELLEGRKAVIPFAEDGQLCLMPVDEVAGGLLLKQRNVAGDLVVDLGEPLRAHGFDDWGDHEVEVGWSSRLGALTLAPPAATGTAALTADPTHP